MLFTSTCRERSVTPQRRHYAKALTSTNPNGAFVAAATNAATTAVASPSSSTNDGAAGGGGGGGSTQFTQAARFRASPGKNAASAFSPFSSHHQHNQQQHSTIPAEGGGQHTPPPMRFGRAQSPATRTRHHAGIVFPNEPHASEKRLWNANHTIDSSEYLRTVTEAAGFASSPAPLNARSSTSQVSYNPFSGNIVQRATYMPLKRTFPERTNQRQLGGQPGQYDHYQAPQDQDVSESTHRHHVAKHPWKNEFMIGGTPQRSHHLTPSDNLTVSSLGLTPLPNAPGTEAKIIKKKIFKDGASPHQTHADDAAISPTPGGFGIGFGAGGAQRRSASASATTGGGGGGCNDWDGAAGRTSVSLARSRSTLRLRRSNTPVTLLRGAVPLSPRTVVSQLYNRHTTGASNNSNNNTSSNNTSSKNVGAAGVSTETALAVLTPQRRGRLASPHTYRSVDPCALAGGAHHLLSPEHTYQNPSSMITSTVTSTSTPSRAHNNIGSGNVTPVRRRNVAAAAPFEHATPQEVGKDKPAKMVALRGRKRSITPNSSQFASGHNFVCQGVAEGYRPPMSLASSNEASCGRRHRRSLLPPGNFAPNDSTVIPNDKCITVDRKPVGLRVATTTGAEQMTGTNTNNNSKKESIAAIMMHTPTSAAADNGTTASSSSLQPSSITPGKGKKTNFRHSTPERAVVACESSSRPLFYDAVMMEGKGGAAGGGGGGENGSAPPKHAPATR